MTSSPDRGRPTRQHEQQENHSQPLQEYQVLTRVPFLKLLNFYTGVTLCLCGVGVFLIGATSRKWVELEVDVGVVMRPASRERILSHMGPWLACNYGHHCDKPWILAPGLDERSVRGVQTMLLLVILTYLSGAAIIILQLLRPKGFLELRACKCLLDNAIAEGVIPTGAIMAFLFILMMGELKRKLILQSGETVKPGWAFVVCLVSVLATIVGSLCMVFNRQSAGCVTATCGTMFGDQPIHPSGAMLRKRESVRRDLVSRPAPQHTSGSDMCVAGANNIAGGTDTGDESVYQVNLADEIIEAEMRHRELMVEAVAESRCRRAAQTDGSSAFQEGTFVEIERCKETTTNCFGSVGGGEHSTEQHVELTATNLPTQGGDGDQLSQTVSATNCDIGIGQVARSRPRLLEKPRLLETQADWQTCYPSDQGIITKTENPLDDSSRSGYSKPTEISVTQTVPHLKNCSVEAETLDNQLHVPQNHEAQNMDLLYKTGEVTL